MNRHYLITLWINKQPNDTLQKYSLQSNFICQSSLLFSWYLERNGELRRLVPSSRIHIHLETLTLSQVGQHFIQLINKYTNFTVYLFQMNTEDTGIYTCHATNSILQDSARYIVSYTPRRHSFTIRIFSSRIFDIGYLRIRRIFNIRIFMQYQKI